jgi:hypothetical protein
MIPPRKPIPKASFEEIIRDGPVGDLQKKQYRLHQVRRRNFRSNIAPGLRAEIAEQLLQDAMAAEGLDEAGLWRALANPHLPEEARLRGALIERVRSQLRIPVAGDGGASQAGKRRRKGKRPKKKPEPKRFVHKAQGQTRKTGSQRSPN